MARIQFSTNGSTPSYTFTYNPVRIEVPQAIRSDIINSVEVVDGESIAFTPGFDSRRGKLIWEKFTVDFTAFTNQIGTIGTYVGTKFYIDFHEIGDMLTGIDQPLTGWVYAKGIALDKVLREGGPFAYDHVDFVFELAE